MSLIVTQPVTSRRQRREFLNLPWKIYRGDPNWVPPLLMSVKELVGYRRHPFHDRNDVQTFVAARDGEVVGRIAAIENRGHNERYDERRGFFGFFESIDDQQVARSLFDAVQEWFGERNITSLRGPTNPSMNYECGLLVEGFETPPTFMMTYNPRYYGELIEACGFEKSQDMYAYWGHADMVARLDKKIQFMADACVERFNVTCRDLDRRRFEEEVKTYLHLYNQSLQNMWGFVPLSESEVGQLAKEMKYIIEPELTVLAEVDGKVVAAVFCLLDYNMRIKQMKGRLFPFNFLKLLRNRRAIRRVRAVTVTVLPEFQRWGLGIVVMNRLCPKCLNWPLEECEFSWILESNLLSKQMVERAGGKLVKTYRIYDLEV